MKKLKMINTSKIVFSALMFGALSLGYAQTTTTPKDSVAAAVAESATMQQNPEIEVLKKQVAANANDTESLVKLATAYGEAKDWANALATWNSVSTLLPDWAPAYYSKGQVYQSMKDDANARMAYEKYISSVKPEEMEASKKNLAYAEFFVAYNLKESDKESAKKHIAKSLEYDPMNADATKLKTFLNQ